MFELGSVETSKFILIKYFMKEEPYKKSYIFMPLVYNCWTIFICSLYEMRYNHFIKFLIGLKNDYKVCCHIGWLSISIKNKKYLIRRMWEWEVPIKVWDLSQSRKNGVLGVIPEYTICSQENDPSEYWDQSQNSISWTLGLISEPQMSNSFLWEELKRS